MKKIFSFLFLNIAFVYAQKESVEELKNQIQYRKETLLEGGALNKNTPSFDQSSQIEEKISELASFLGGMDYKSLESEKQKIEEKILDTVKKIIEINKGSVENWCKKVSLNKYETLSSKEEYIKQSLKNEFLFTKIQENISFYLNNAKEHSENSEGGKETESTVKSLEKKASFFQELKDLLTEEYKNKLSAFTLKNQIQNYKRKDSESVNNFKKITDLENDWRLRNAWNQRNLEVVDGKIVEKTDLGKLELESAEELGKDTRKLKVPEDLKKISHIEDKNGKNMRLTFQE
ncbi:hypothetical protein [Holospora elegans]|nr:hypothetical protein [Holospora elegans]